MVDLALITWDGCGPFELVIYRIAKVQRVMEDTIPLVVHAQIVLPLRKAAFATTCISRTECYRVTLILYLCKILISVKGWLSR